MARKRYVQRLIEGEYKLVDVTDDSSAANVRPQVHYISDDIPATWHPANGQTYTSKSQFRRATKAAGCVEIGNEPVHNTRQKEADRAWKESKGQRFEAMCKAYKDIAGRSYH